MNKYMECLEIFIMKKYFQYLDLDWEPVATKLKEFILNDPVLISSIGWENLSRKQIPHIIPYIFSMLKPLNVKPVQVALHTTINQTPMAGIHSDHEIHECRRVLIPVMNCENSIINFFKTIKEPILTSQPNGVPYYQANYEDCELVDQCCLNRAIAFRPKELHSVHYHDTSNHGHGTNLLRISCPITVDKDLNHLFY